MLQGFGMMGRLERSQKQLLAAFDLDVASKGDHRVRQITRDLGSVLGVRHTFTDDGQVANLNRVISSELDSAHTIL